ncbi:heme anaerobic degradation radical SAM methyltransferase ChuW/HutW [Vibrio sp. IRLE0018]|uniref:heme anaerobic degradation radical SAM methyltransferase ChuW/HutW n=1 Tax=Vibrio TaxID=662 RepID=UPI0015938956|nr:MULTISPECIES: heme anaerobic degradation radical SAM methyltransferase ChuW/HutW [Vibrio]MCF8777599.1 heme anaerobic degradation radical SAM methyltransferase ChuW/HutW [Vibrio floridensis]
MTLKLNKYDQSILGVDSPDPLRFAFAQKHSAHAGGMSRPIAQTQMGERFRMLTSNDEVSRNKRCLYIHIPFCRVRCTFCNFFQNAASRQLVDGYFNTLLKEIEQKAALPWTQSGVFHAVYIGGGTPTDLSPKQVKQLGEAIRSRFPLSADCEITLEGRINRFKDEMYDSAIQGGFNRFSFGVQSFNTVVRRSAKRLDDREQVLARLSELASYDQAPVIVDLLYGLPHQTREILEQDLQDFLSTGAHGLDLYQLVIGGTAPMLNLVEKGKLPPPATTPQKASMYELGVNFMQKHHLKQLSVNHWATDNRERSLYNSLAKTYAEVLPIGCGAGGSIGGFGMMQHRSLEAYMAMVEQGQTPLMMMTQQHPLEAIFAALKSGFDRGVVMADKLPEFMGDNVFDFLQPLFRLWQERGLVELNERSATLTLAGSFWSVSLAQACIQILSSEYQNAEQTHAIAL